MKGYQEASPQGEAFFLCSFPRNIGMQLSAAFPLEALEMSVCPVGTTPKA